MRQLFCCIIIFTLLFTTSNAQTSEQTEPQTIAECLDFVQQYSKRQADGDRKAGRRPDYRVYQVKARELARQYAARFKVEGVNEADLPVLARLYLEADETALARQAINWRLNTVNISESDRADALATAVVIMTKGAPGVEDIRLAEDFTAQLDALSNAVLKQKIAAHKRLAGYYGSNDLEEEKFLGHNNIILKLVEQLPPEERDKYAWQNLSVYDRIATTYANRGLIEKALESLLQGRAETIRQGRAQADGTTLFDSAIERYSLLGQPGAPLKGAYWINASPVTSQLDLRGQVTLIQFTAHWCAPCRDSYPGMLKLHRQFNRRGLDVVMSTQLYGYFARRQDLKPEEEMAANREYYMRQHKLPFKIAVDPYLELSDKTAVTEARRREANHNRYFVGGIPQIVLLDKQGIIRLILTGWSPDNEARLTRLIGQLLKEPSVARKQ
jgi:thiol-disulfide isomerase/thioredoxin